jgi:hypothetical protein
MRERDGVGRRGREGEREGKGEGVGEREREEGGSHMIIEVFLLGNCVDWEKL